MLITLNLIVTNVYNSVKAPAQRGFSYIEIWMIGVQIPILVGIFEYAILLALKKYHNGKDISTLVSVSPHDKEQKPTPVYHSQKNLSTVTTTNLMESNWDIIERTMDKWTFMGTLAFILSFNIFYWFLTLM